MSMDSVDAILDFAIDEEAKAAVFYKDLAAKMERPHMKIVFEDFAREELGHKRKLLDMKAGKVLLPAKEKVLDLKIADYTVEAEPNPGMNYADALVLAMKAEKAAFKLYHDLARTADDPNIRAALMGLAQEEAKHKLRFEIEYDEYVLTEN